MRENRLERLRPWNLEQHVISCKKMVEVIFRQWPTFGEQEVRQRVLIQGGAGMFAGMHATRRPGAREIRRLA